MRGVVERNRGRRRTAAELLWGLVDRALEALDGERESAEARLLRKAREKQARWSRHLRTFVVVTVGLGAVNVITGLSGVEPFAWSLVVAVVWGMGVALHGLGFRAWRGQHAAELRRAREVLAARGADPARAEGDEAAADPTWSRLLERAREASGEADAALVRSGAADPEHPARRQLREGLLQLEALGAGAGRIHAVLRDLAPGGGSELDRSLAQLDAKVAAAGDEGLRAVFARNRGLLVARREKVGGLERELARMEASAEGFVFAAENLRLDAARLGAGAVPSLAGALDEPLAHLGEEVEILRQVEEELEAV